MIFFKRKKVPDAQHLCFRTKASKYAYLPGMIASESKQVWFFCFFDQTYAELKEVLLSAGIPFQESRNRSPETVICLYDRVPPDPMDEAVLVFLEDHPLYSESEKLRKELFRLGAQDIKIMIGMDEPIMQIFGGDRLQQLMDRMGMGEDEVIENSMVSKSIERAQKKLDEKIQSKNLIHTSVELWFENNRY
jgi:hypothetical protein